MEPRDLIVTPLIVILVYGMAYAFRPFVTDEINKRFFISALTVRVIGALAVGFIYQFYYHGGDTYNFHTHGSRHIWEAFMDSPSKGLKLLFSDQKDMEGIYKYASRIAFFKDKSSYTIIQIAAFFDLFTFSSYSATAVCFAVMSFIGSWMLFLTFYKAHPHLVRPIAIATLFLPSVFFWGSGLLKDTITLAFLGCATFFVRRIFIERRIKLTGIVILLFSLFVVYSIKKYILLCYLPAVLLWLYTTYLNKVGSIMLRFMLLPFMLVIIAASGYFTVTQIGEDDPRYNMNKIAFTARETAYDIAYQTGRDAGSSYSLGELDGSFGGLVRLAPQAVNVSLFRPYLWEIRNPLMLMSALESFLLLLLTLYTLYKARGFLIKSLSNPNVLFCLVFSITFAFAVGVSTFNFGTLSRYKIPLLPFYTLAMIFIYDQANKERKLAAFDSTE